MRKSGTILETQHTPITREKVILNYITSSDVYCINHLSDQANEDCGIIAAIGDKSKINYLLHINLDKVNNHAAIKIKKPDTVLPAPAFNKIKFLNQIQGTTVRSFNDCSYEFGIHLEHDLNAKYKEYIQNPKNNLAIVTKDDNHR